MADYSNIYPYIRTRLQDSVAEVENSAFDKEIASSLRRLLIPYGKTYDDVIALAGDDLALVNEAAGLLTAARLVIPYSTGGMTSAVVSEHTEDQGRSFRVGSEESGENQVWKKEAMEAMSLVSFAINSAARSYGRFAVDGFRRQTEAEAVEEVE
jgi:hypothetical protein